MSKEFIFTSESVSAGHPDKMADQISDAVLDEIYRRDPNHAKARVACETLVKTGFVMLAGEIFLTDSNLKIDYESVVRRVVRDIGYDNSEVGFDANTCGVLVALGEQSQDIHQGVDRDSEQAQGAGDQGLMFGYATNETDMLMPAPLDYAHRLMRRHSQLLTKGTLPWLRPDAKSQVSMRYRDGRPVGVDAVVLSTQHSDTVSESALREAVMDEIIRPVFAETGWLTDQTRYHINPTGKFVIGGPVGDCGLTGRKIIVDTYGGMARHGGGAFSGKDPSKVDRSAAYAGRYVAKNLVAAGIAERCEIQISYAIGVAEPTSIAVETFGTSRLDDERIVELVKAHFDLTPYGIIRMLDLTNRDLIRYQDTAAYGHFGRDEPGFTWERTDKAEELRAAAGR